MLSLKYHPWGNTLLASTLRCSRGSVVVLRLRISRWLVRRGQIKYLMAALDNSKLDVGKENLTE